MQHFLIREFRSRWMARFVFWTIISWILLHIIGVFTHAVPLILWVFVWIGIFVSAVYYLFRLIAFARQRLLWKLSRRLAVTYIFIAFVPIVLILILVLIGAIIGSGQFAAFLVSVRLRNHFDELQQLNRVVVHEAVHTTARTPEALIAQLRNFYDIDLKQYAMSYPGLVITVRAGLQAQAFDLTGEDFPHAAIVPRWLVQHEWDGMVIDWGGGIFLRAVNSTETPAGPLALILSIPITPSLLDLVGSGIGPVALWEIPGPGHRPPDPQPRASSRNIPQLTQGRDTHRPPVGHPRPRVIRSTSIHLPPKLGWFDFAVAGFSEINPVEWRASQYQLRETPAIVAVSSRIFTLNRQLFSTLGRQSSLPVDLFIAIAIVFLAIEIVAFLIGIKLTRTITSTVNRLQLATEWVKAGNLSHRIGLPPLDQLSALGSAFDSMTASIERLLVESREKTRLEGELNIAREVQTQLFPREAPELPGVKLYGVCRPARGVSGDYYDFLKVDPQRIALVLGDVSGKGISAALLMAGIQSAVHAQFYDGYAPGRFPEPGISPAGVMTRLNRQLYASTSEEKYATFFYAVYDAQSRTLAYTNAGHPPPVLFRDHALLRLDSGGTVLGLFPQVHYEQAEIQVRPGDVLVAFTDGLTEPENSYAEEFGETRLIATVREDLDSPPELVAEEVYRRITDWTGGGEPQDDMTMLYLKVVDR
jgi:sigma-B regulation protein RsbU (phosphoserine phosphatase)